MSDAAPLLVAERVSKTYRPRGRPPTAALVEASLVVAPGEVAAVSGPSGGGKTTLLSLLAAVERPDAGRVVLCGEDLSGRSEASLAALRRRVGIVFQGSPALRGLPIWENVTLPLVPAGVSASARRALAERWLARLGLADRVESAAETASAGEAQRMGVARALVGEPMLVVADEPTAHLDPATAEVVVAMLFEVAARGGAVVVATHDEALLARATTRRRMEAGRLL